MGEQILLSPDNLRRRHVAICSGLSLFAGCLNRRIDLPEPPLLFAYRHDDPRADKELSWQKVIRQYVPLAARLITTPDDSLVRHFYVRVKPVLEKFLLENGYAGVIPVTATVQDFGVPVAEEFAASSLRYAKRAEEFLYSSLKCVAQLPWEWTGVKPGQSFVEGYDGKAFIADATFRVAIFLTGPCKAGMAQYSQGGRFVSYLNENTGKIDFRYLIITAGPEMLISVFSEILPLTTRPHLSGFAKKHGIEETQAAAEAIEEGLSYHLARRMMKKLKIPSSILENYLDEFSQKEPYKYLRSAIEFIEKTGLQESLSLFIGDPERFYAEVK